MDPNEILERLAVDAVLLPIKSGTKQPTGKAWQQRTFSETSRPAYVERLRKAPAIGVLLGGASQGLCSIDFDCDLFLIDFLNRNPAFLETLRTKGQRGGNLWLIVEGELPKSRKLTASGKPVGEWRANGNQTIIAGIHPEGGTYQRTKDAPPLRVRFEEIDWPALDCREFSSPSSSNLSQSSPFSPSSPGSPYSPSLHSLHNIAARLKASEQARRELEGNRGLYHLYRQFIEKRPLPRQGSRNTDLVSMITFLSRAVGKERALALARAFHSVNQDIFTDPLEQHMHEAEAHLAACEETWRGELSEYERQVADQLPRGHCEAFRICRDLADLDVPASPRGKLFISMGDLANRLSLHAPEAQRILRVLESLGCLEIETKGTRHAKGVRGAATRYRWKLDLPKKENDHAMTFD